MGSLERRPLDRVDKVLVPAQGWVIQEAQAWQALFTHTSLCRWAELRALGVPSVERKLRRLTQLSIRYHCKTRSKITPQISIMIKTTSSTWQRTTTIKVDCCITCTCRTMWTRTSSQSQDRLQTTTLPSLRSPTQTWARRTTPQIRLSHTRRQIWVMLKACNQISTVSRSSLCEYHKAIVLSARMLIRERNCLILIGTARLMMICKIICWVRVWGRSLTIMRCRGRELVQDRGQLDKTRLCNRWSIVTPPRPTWKLICRIQFTRISSQVSRNFTILTLHVSMKSTVTCPVTRKCFYSSSWLRMKSTLEMSHRKRSSTLLKKRAISAYLIRLQRHNSVNRSCTQQLRRPMTAIFSTSPNLRTSAALTIVCQTSRTSHNRLSNPLTWIVMITRSSNTSNKTIKSELLVSI